MVALVTLVLDSHLPAAVITDISILEYGKSMLSNSHLSICRMLHHFHHHQNTSGSAAIISPPHTHTYVLFVIDTFSHWSSNMPSRLKSVMNISWMKLPHIILRKGLSNIKLPMWIYNGKIAQSLNRHKTFAQSLMSVLQTDTLAYQKKDYFYTYNILIRHIRLAHISFIDH